MDWRADCVARPIKPESEESGRTLAAEKRHERREEKTVLARGREAPGGEHGPGSGAHRSCGAERGAGDAQVAKLRVQ
jgi:hypothetical protein